MNVWLEILRNQTEARGNATVARELGLSDSTISLALNNKYPAGTGRIEKKVISIYGSKTGVDCPALGKITPARCVTNWERAKKIGVRLGDPQKIRLYKECLKCSLRNN